MNKKLINVVIKQLGGGDQTEVLENVYNHGADGGFSGFTSYYDTMGFFKKNKKLILELLVNISEDLDEDPFFLIKTFNCLKDEKLLALEIAEVLYGGDKKSDVATILMNALSWFALERVAREVIQNEL